VQIPLLDVNHLLEAALVEELLLHLLLARFVIVFVGNNFALAQLERHRVVPFVFQFQAFNVFI
jgi:hypothetical protein